MSKTVITIEHLEAGQPRAHADSRFHARIKAERHGVYLDDRVIPGYMTREEVEQLVKIFVHDFKDVPQWPESRLDRICPKNPKIIAGKSQSGEWEVLVVTPSTN